MEKAGVHQRDLYVSFIDYKKAFDCVDHEILWDGVCEKEVRRRIAMGKAASTGAWLIGTRPTGTRLIGTLNFDRV